MFKLLTHIFGSNPWPVGAVRKGKKLSRKEYDELLYNLRKLTPHIRSLVAPLVHHADYCNQKVIALEDELRELKQKHFFEAPKPSNVIDGAPSWKKEPKVFAPLPLRLKAMLENNEYGSDNWKRHLKYNNLTDEQALELARGETENAANEIPRDATVSSGRTRAS